MFGFRVNYSPLGFLSFPAQELPSYPDDGYNPHNYHYSGGGTSGEQPFNEMEVRLMRQVSGFGFRIIGGREEGSQVKGGVSIIWSVLRIVALCDSYYGFS